MADIRPEEQSEKTESCRENLWNEVQLKGPKRETDIRTEYKKRNGQARLIFVFDINCNIPSMQK